MKRQEAPNGARKRDVRVPKSGVREQPTDQSATRDQKTDSKKEALRKAVRGTGTRQTAAADPTAKKTTARGRVGGRSGLSNARSDGRVSARVTSAGEVAASKPKARSHGNVSSGMSLSQQFLAKKEAKQQQEQQEQEEQQEQKEPKAEQAQSDAPIRPAPVSFASPTFDYEKLARQMRPSCHEFIVNKPSTSDAPVVQGSYLVAAATAAAAEAEAEKAKKEKRRARQSVNPALLSSIVVDKKSAKAMQVKRKAMAGGSMVAVRTRCLPFYN